MSILEQRLELPPVPEVITSSYMENVIASPAGVIREPLSYCSNVKGEPEYLVQLMRRTVYGWRQGIERNFPDQTRQLLANRYSLQGSLMLDRYFVRELYYTKDYGVNASIWKSWLELYPEIESDMLQEVEGVHEFSRPIDFTDLKPYHQGTASFSAPYHRIAYEVVNGTLMVEKKVDGILQLNQVADLIEPRPLEAWVSSYRAMIKGLVSEGAIERSKVHDLLVSISVGTRKIMADQLREAFLDSYGIEKKDLPEDFYQRCTALILACNIEKMEALTRGVLVDFPFTTVPAAEERRSMGSDEVEASARWLNLPALEAYVEGVTYFVTNLPAFIPEKRYYSRTALLNGLIGFIDYVNENLKMLPLDQRDRGDRALFYLMSSLFDSGKIFDYGLASRRHQKFVDNIGPSNTQFVGLLNLYQVFREYWQEKNAK